MPAIKSEDNVVVSKGNPFTPSQFITSKWEDPENDPLRYYFSVDDGETQDCAEYLGSENQVTWFNYVFEETGHHKIEIWANDGEFDSPKFVANVEVVDPETYTYPIDVAVLPGTDRVKFYKTEGHNEEGYDILGDEIAPEKEEDVSGAHVYTVNLKKGEYLREGLRALDVPAHSVLALYTSLIEDWGFCIRLERK